MYKPIQLSDHRNDHDNSSSYLEKISLDIFDESKKEDYKEESIFTEAVFLNGKEKLAPLLESIITIKNDLEEKIKDQSVNKSHQFNPEDFWKSSNFKVFEDKIKEIFGFRFVSIEPYIEKYDSSEDNFESKELNCVVYRADRYPVDGLVTDNGFYDKSHSLVMNIYITLGLIHILEPEEILAVFLHEFGHNIDPALMTIKYAEANILSKYLTERNGELTDSEKNVVKSKMDIISRALNIFKFKK